MVFLSVLDALRCKTLPRTVAPYLVKTLPVLAVSETTLLESLFNKIEDYPCKWEEFHQSCLDIFPQAGLESESNHFFAHFFRMAALRVGPPDSVVEAKLYALLEYCLDLPLPLSKRTLKAIDDISHTLMPVRDAAMTLSMATPSFLSHQLKNTERDFLSIPDPYLQHHFWSVIEQYRDKIQSILSGFTFLQVYHEFISFDTKTKIMHARLSALVNSESLIWLDVPRKQLFPVSFDQLKGKNLNSRIVVTFTGEKAHDAGGPFKNWLTLMCEHLI